MADHPILFIPGPVEVDAELREIMATPLVGHRSAAFLEVVQDVCHKLRGVFLTESRALLENCPATALMEAAVRNLVRERILHLTCGAFSERWLTVSTRCGRSPDALQVGWGEPNLPDVLRATLATSPPFEAVAITHSETSTGLRNPLPELAAVIREVAPDTLILVDAVTSLGGAELRFDDWGLDVAFAGTQKCLALPPGLCVYALSERALARAGRVPDRGYLLDFVTAAEGLAAGKTPATPCVPLVLALSRQLDRIGAEGLAQRWERHAAMQRAVGAFAAGEGYDFLVAEPYRSPTVSALRSSGRDVQELIARSARAGFTLGGGYGRLRGKTFRIGHLGDHEPATLAALLDALRGA